jgi:hypothetical protein
MDMVTSESDGFWQRLLHRWFIEYNPLYLLSAALVLLGVNQISPDLKDEGNYGLLVGAAIAELYAWALIAGAALLTRIELRRPAVMLALLCALYQGDPTLHSETCAYLGTTGVVAVSAWLVSFVGKLYALAWALRVRLSGSAIAVPTFGALGAVMLPQLADQLPARTLTSVVSLWLFVLFAFALWSSREVRSLVPLDGWGQTVLRRAREAIWALWTVLTLAHVWFWAREFSLNFLDFSPVFLLVSTRWRQRERTVWATVAGALLLSTALPGSFSITALMAALVLALYAVRRPSDIETDGATEFSPVQFGPASPATRRRMVVGSLYGLYLAVWTIPWSGGPLPEHVISLDLLLSAGLLILMWKARIRTAGIGPLVGTYAHLAVQTGTISAPETRLQWGLSYVGVGFGLLVGSLAASFGWRKPG